MEVDGLLLCSECENQLKVDVYSKKFGFYKVYPCKHCAAQDRASSFNQPLQSLEIEELSSGLVG